MSIEKIGIVVGPKGRGTNMRAIIEACQRGDIPAEVLVVISPKDSNPAAEFARSKGVSVATICPGDDYEAEMHARLADCSIVCLAGYMRLLPHQVLEDHPGRVLNIHPALLPKHGGKGMYGYHVHAAVIENREPESGCTVHMVTDAYDEGDIVLQKRCPVLPDDTPETLGARVLELEVLTYPEAILKVIRGEAS